MINKARILWDMDDTLNPLMRSWFEWFGLQRAQGEVIAYAEIIQNPPHNLLGISYEEYLISLDRFRISAKAASMPVEPNVYAWFTKHGHQFEHHVLTARPAPTVHAAAEWVFRNPGSWIRHFHFVPAARPWSNLPDEAASKASMIRQMGRFDYFFDDTDLNFSGVGKDVGQCFFVPQPWNCQSLKLSQILCLIA